MTREEYIKKLISKNGYNIKSFAAKIEIPYSTLLSILNGNVGGAAVDNVIKICTGLGITVDELEKSCNRSNVPTDPQFQHLTDNYNRMNQGGQKKLVDISDELVGNPANTAPEKVKLKMVAFGGMEGLSAPEVTQEDIENAKRELERIRLKKDLGIDD